MNPESLQDELSKLGKTIIKLPGETANTEWITTGSMIVDVAFGGGFPLGYQTELFGPEGGGKSTLALQSCVEAVSNGRNALYIDAENKTPPEYPANLGIPDDQFVMARPETLSEATTIVDIMSNTDEGTFTLIRPYNGPQALDLVKYALDIDNSPAIIVVDSVAALQTSAEMDAEAGDHHVGVQARMMSQNLKVLKALVGKGTTALVWINQIRMKIGTMFGNPETTSGGKALRFYTSIRGRVSRTGWLTDNGKRTGITATVRTYKNALSSPGEPASFDIIWGKGIDKYADAIEFGLEKGTVSSGGGYFKIMDTIKLYESNERRGRNTAIKILREHPEYLEPIRTGVLDMEDECHKEDDTHSDS